jgi:Lhr-like helicase
MQRYGHRQFVETQRFRKEPDGSGILEATVNSLNEVAAWIVSHSDGVKVLEPAELKHRVIGLAEQAIAQNR